MRKLILIAPLVLAACGEAEEPVQNQAVEAANGLEPGLWEVSSEVTAFEQADEGEPVIDAAVGSIATENICVGEGDRPPTELFAGEAYDCEYSNYYARNGRMNLTLNCSLEGASGNIAMAVEGTFAGDSFEVSRDITTYLTGQGDVRTKANVTGRRVGECPAEAEAAAGEAAQNAAGAE